jgi:aminoglycoside phosphotransferase (APT) family kinase protein
VSPDPLKPLSRQAVEHVRDVVAPGGRIIRVRPLHGGLSSSVHLINLHRADGRRQAVVVRRCGAYWQRTDPAAPEREFKLLNLLARQAFPAPTPLLLDADGGPFGAPTIVMTRLPGRPLLAPTDLSDYIEQIAAMLVRLHWLPVTADLEFLPDQWSLVERTLSAPGPKGDPLQEEVWAEVQAAWASVSELTLRRALLHGDFWPGNLLWRRGRLVGVIDWERPRLGDPAKDVATCRGDLSILFGLETADAFLRTYERLSGITIQHLRFWDLLISTWAVREIADWASVYPVFGRTDVSVDLARERIRAFARAAIAENGAPRKA